jgi:protein phosphatase 1 regulatory subunit 12A
VKFSKEVMFLAAVSSGDQSEVERVLQEEGVDVNCRNNDGLTAIHQCCIDDDIHMLQVLVNHGGNVNSVDNEGWTPLHAATSCNFAHIVKYLLENNAFPAPVNNEGQTPLDLAEEYDDIADLLNKEINRLGIDVDDVKCEEERIMLEDAKKLRNNPKLEAMVSPGGATPLHVAAAKNYTTVIHVLLSIKGIDVDARDDDGWTPLHAAVHWESMEAAELLILSGANIYVKTDAGEELDDLVDPDLEDDLKQLKKLNSVSKDKRCD